MTSFNYILLRGGETTKCMRCNSKRIYLFTYIIYGWALGPVTLEPKTKWVYDKELRLPFNMMLRTQGLCNQNDVVSRQG